MSVRMRHTRSHTRNRRSHHALKERRFGTCPNCATPHMWHYACLNCGQYRGKEVINVSKRIEKKERKIKEREKTAG